MNLDSVVSISGYGWSGSTALRDFLREYDSIYHVTDKSSKRFLEYSLLYDPDGFLDLYNKLVASWNFLHIDKALKDHIKYFNRISAEQSKLNPHGLGLDELFKVDSRRIHSEFLEELASFKYHLSSRVNNLYDDPLLNFCKRWYSKFSPSHRKDSYFSSADDSSFSRALVKFHNELFANVGKDKLLLIEKMIPVNNIELCSSLLPNIKVLIVDRDPRDTFVEMVKKRTLFFGGNGSITDTEVMQFCRWKEQMYRTGVVNEIPYGRDVRLGSMQVLKLDFEEFVLRFSDSQLTIEGFLGLSRENHIHRFKCFNSEDSKKNIGKWVEYKNPHHIEIIEKSIPSYFHRPKNFELN